MSGRAAAPPARGRLVFLSHPQPRAAAVAARVRAAGHRAHALPAFGLAPTAPRALDDAADRLGDYGVAVMVSPTAVALLAQALAGRPWPAGTTAAVVGRGSRDALGEHGLAPAAVLVPAGSADADALLAEPALARLAGQRVLVVRGETGRDDLAATLAARGARVDELRAYARVPVDWAPAARDALLLAAQAGDDAVFVFTTAAGAERVAGFLATHGGSGLAWAQGRPALAVHPRIVSALRDAGWRDAREIPPGVEALVAALESA